MMRSNGVEVDMIHAREHCLAFGLSVDMTEQGADRDEWPELYERIKRADILVLGSPIWLGVKSSVCTLVIERLYGTSSDTNERGQYVYYGKVGGCLVTGNEDGIKAVSSEILYGLQHIGFSIPPGADAGWIGEAGPGPSYGDTPEQGQVPVGFDNEFTNKNTTVMTYNLMHLARLLRDAGGFPIKGNRPDDWSEGRRFGFPLNSDGTPA